MFDPTKEVPSLELCKKLRGLGYPQDGGGWYWIRRVGHCYWELALMDSDKKGENLRTWHKSGKYEWMPIGYTEERIKAPTCRELGEWFPQKWNIVSIQYSNGYWGISSHEVKRWRIWEADTEPNARAKMLIWLREKGYVDFDKEK